MVCTNRTCTALSPISQNQSVDVITKRFTPKIDALPASRSSAANTTRSALRAKLAHASSTLLRSPSLSTRKSCPTELPLVNAMPFASREIAQVRAGLKRKKGAREQLGGVAHEPTQINRSFEKLEVEASTADGSRRIAPRTPRRRSGKQIHIVTSPHLPRDKPSSSASELSDWSSVVSTSPTASRVPTSRAEESAAVQLSRPGIQTRRSSRNSLYKTLDGMTLEDSLASVRSLARSSRSQSRSVSRKNSNLNAGNDNETGFPSAASHRIVSAHKVPDSELSSEASIDMDDKEAEQARLVSSAPTWQLHRLRKDELVQLCLSARAWDASPTDAELELVTKQDLVNQIITCRSRLDHSRSDELHASTTVQRQSRSVRSSYHTYKQRSNDLPDEHADESDALWMALPARESLHRSARSSLCASPTGSADDDEADLTDASNEAGGEETEAEPHGSPSSRRHMGRPSQARLKAYEGGALRRMDSSTFDEFEPSKANQAPRRQLRDKTTLRNGVARRQLIGNASEAMSASTSSSIFGGRSSRASNTSHSAFVQRRQLGVFVASSPIRTRSRTARLTAGLPSRRKVGTRVVSASIDGASTGPDPMATPKVGHRLPQRTKKSVKFCAASPGQHGEYDRDEWMEDLSSGSDDVAVGLQTRSISLLQDEHEHTAVRNAPTRCSTRRTLRTRRSTAESEASFTFLPPRSRSASSEAASSATQEDDLVAERDGDVDMANSDHGDDDVAATPTKFRKLRNGKLRLVVGASNGDSNVRTSGNEQLGDVDMESAAEHADRSREQRTESPDSDTAPSEGLDSVMAQPTFATLTRLRKSELGQLCLDRAIDMDGDDKKANLIKKLLDWFQLSELDAAKNADSDADDGDETQSDISNATAVAQDDQAQAGQRTPTRRRNTRATSNAHASATDSDQPLLLRARSTMVSSEKLLTPPLTSNNEEAAAPQVGDGVDELNGLDLESLNLTDKEIAPSKLEKLEKIGSGGFKDVYVGKYRISKTRVNKVAIADIRDQLTEMDIKELSLLRDLRHENIVRFIGVSIPEDPRHVPCMIVSELCSNGDLFDYIRNTAAPSDAEVFRILLETARGLEYLHTRTPAIIHRDCKSTNVLITRRKTAKINDFGLARVKNTSRSMMRSLVGTVNWQAVELWVPKPQYNEKVDVWSAAMTFWEALQWHQPEKKYPFQGMNEHQIYQDVGQKRQRPYTGFIRRQFGDEIVDLLDRMWDQTPKNRPSMTEVCNELESLIQMKKDAAAATAATAGSSIRFRA